MQEDVYQGDGLNLYEYCRNNPVVYYDPSGYSCENSGDIAGDENIDSNEKIIFYHGTSTEGANSIYNNGIDLNHATRDMDFGRGFYVTINIEQARNWAARHGADGGAIIKFNIPLSEYNNLNNKLFYFADSDWGNFVINSRKGMTNNYDTISGPMLLNPRKALDGETPKSGGQQTAFNTQAAIDLLNKYMSIYNVIDYCL